MLTITLTATSEAVGTISIPLVLAPSQADRLMAYFAASVPGTPAEQIGAWWAGVVKGTLIGVIGYECCLAREAASASVDSVTATLDGEAL